MKKIREWILKALRFLATKIREWLFMVLLFLAFINLEVAMWLDPTGELDKVWEEREMDNLL